MPAHNPGESTHHRNWSWDPSLYAGSAAHYATGRLAYPPELATVLVTELGLAGTGTLLDVGCGPGSLTLLLAPNFARAIGVDADQEMVDQAARQAAAHHVDNVSWRCMRAEDLPADLPSVDVITFAQSFHWMDRPRVAAAARRLLALGGALVHVSATTHRGVTTGGQDPPWDAITDLVETYLGPKQAVPGDAPGNEDEIYRAAEFDGPPHAPAESWRRVHRTDPSDRLAYLAMSWHGTDDLPTRRPGSSVVACGHYTRPSKYRGSTVEIEGAPPEPWRLRSAQVLFDMVGDPRAGCGLLGVSDPDVHLLNGRWTMFLGGFTTRFVVRIVEARLPVGADVTDNRWRIVTGGRRQAVHHGAPTTKGTWDRAGMHTPCYVIGQVDGRVVERIYYAGRATTHRTGPRSRYAIGVIERAGDGWARRDAPVIHGDDERPSVLEPRVIFADGKWRVWFLSAIGEVGRGEQPDYELRYAESADGLSWSRPVTFATTGEGFFDNAVQFHDGSWSMVLARGTNLYGTQPYPCQGLWWSQSSVPGPRAHWSPPARMLDTAQRPEAWFAAGVCGPSFVYDTHTEGAQRVHVFATGTYARTSWWRASVARLRHGRRPPPPSPYYLATGRLSFDLVPPGTMATQLR